MLPNQDTKVYVGVLPTYCQAWKGGTYGHMGIFYFIDYRVMQP